MAVPDIFHAFRVYGPAARIFETVSTPAGLDVWWTKTSAVHGADYDLGFGPGYDWRAVATKSVANEIFELEIAAADPDWNGTRVGFEIHPKDKFTEVLFRHAGWPADNDHYRSSNYCWAMYLRLLKRYVEHGEVVPYEKRLDV
jgi:uncharacterized protein YndB with AHSA1/START domain